MRVLVLLALIFVLWRSTLFGVASVAPHFFAYHPDFPYAEALLENTGFPQWVYSWGGFDGVHYLSIITEGYLSIRLIQAFFPLYPVISSVVTSLTHEPLLSGLLVSNLSSMALLVVWFLFVRAQFDLETSKKSLVLLLLFPTAFFFGALYSESLFLLAVVLSFWSASKKQWLLAGVFGAVASATRLAGVFIWPALVLEVLLLYAPLRQRVTKKIIWQAAHTQLLPLALITISLLGFLAYSLYLYIYFNDPLYFFSVQKEFNTGRSDTLIFPLQTLWRQVKIIFTVPIDWKWYSYLQDLVLTILTAITLAVGFTKRVRGVKLSWLVFASCAFVLPMLTGSLSSMSRYVLVCFPIYLIGAQLLNTRTKWLVAISISTLLLILNTMLFIQGHWIA
jgi:hypothetical protein